MNRDDDLAIELAAERRRHDVREQARIDAARAELPRTFAAARKEPEALLRRLWRIIERMARRA